MIRYLLQHAIDYSRSLSVSIFSYFLFVSEKIEFAKIYLQKIVLLQLNSMSCLKSRREERNMSGFK